MSKLDPLQLDLLTATQRIRQIWEETDGDTSLGQHLAERLVNCDLPRLESHLTEETRRWAAAQDDITPAEDWEDVIRHLAEAQRIAKTLECRAGWDTYIDEIDGDSALSELIESAKSELAEPLTLPNGHTTTCSCNPERLAALVHPFTD